MLEYVDLRTDFSSFLPTMSDAEQAMSDVAQAVIRLQHYLADIRQYRNTLAVVSRLPKDVLLEIFTQLARLLYETNQVYAASHGSSRPYRWLYAVNTCRRWHSAALSYGSLWADIDLSETPTANANGGRRSSSAQAEPRYASGSSAAPAKHADC